MSDKNNMISKTSCDHFTRHSKCVTQSKKSVQRVVTPKKVVVSKKLPSFSSNDGKSLSTGVISSSKKPTINKPQKTTKSELSFNKKINGSVKSLDYCKKCGDFANNQLKSHSSFYDDKCDEEIRSSITTLVSRNTKSNAKEKISKSDARTPESIKQYYKNENFHFTESIDEMGSHLKKKYLDTIKEVPEIRTLPDDTIFRICSDTDENEFLNTDHQDSIEKLKQFREQNYFECHSAKSRIKNKASVTSLENHECVYRFYLNERLFPVALNTDYNDKIRCVECHLPMGIKLDKENEKVNGTIQAKVKLGSDLKDMTLLLPAKEPLIIKEKRTASRSIQEVVYFGVIKLSSDGNSVFNQTLPDNSLALKYQKGYKEFESKQGYTYGNVAEDDVIII